MNTEELLALHEDTSAKCREIMRRKNNDYTGGQGVDDPFANFNMSSAFGVHPALGVVLRIGDKLQRIRSFANDGALQVSGETIDDACEDIVNYAIIIKGIFRAEAEQCNAEAFKALYGGTVAAATGNNAYAASLDAPDYEPDDYGHHSGGIPPLETPALRKRSVPELVRAMFRDGIPKKDIAELIKVDFETVQHWLTEEGQRPLPA